MSFFDMGVVTVETRNINKFHKKLRQVIFNDHTHSPLFHNPQAKSKILPNCVHPSVQCTRCLFVRTGTGRDY